MRSSRTTKRYSETTRHTFDDEARGSRDPFSDEIAAAAVLIVMAMFGGLTLLYFALR